MKPSKEYSMRFSLVILYLLFMSSIIVSPNTEEQLSDTSHLKLKIILEKPFMTSSHASDSFFKIMKAPGGSGKDYITINPNSTSIISEIFPQLIKIFNHKYCISCNFQGLRVYNEEGNLEYKLDYGDNYFLNYDLSRTDDEGNLFLVLTDHTFKSNAIGYKINVETKEQSILSREEINNLSNIPTNRKLSIDRDLLKDTANNSHAKYRVEPVFGDLKILKKQSDKFYSHIKLNIYNNVTENSTIIDYVDLQKEVHDKIVYSQIYFMDDDMNLYVMGFKSNEYDISAFLDVNHMETKIIKVYNPSLFLWKFEMEN